ncbi:hypothetical protein BGP_3848 [Beggiatoa sp. PS]|nr:hypothetical protein BGP_3848 [Beggiatoa sp. PS]
MAKRRKSNKKPFSQQPLQPDKIPRQSQIVSEAQQKPVWQFKRLDWDGPFGWRNIEKQKWQEIIQKLGQFETRTWAEIKSDGNNHAVDIQNSPNPAVPKRLAEIHLDDIDELFSLRLSGKERIWGILEQHILQIIWWDPNHEVWPSTKKHT